MKFITATQLYKEIQSHKQRHNFIVNLIIKQLTEYFLGQQVVFKVSSMESFNHETPFYLMVFVIKKIDAFR